MKSLQNITKETAYYRGKEITYGICYDAYILELNKLDKKFGRTSEHGNSKMGFNAERSFVDYLGKEAHSSKASWDAVTADGKKWEIRSRDFSTKSTGMNFMSSSAMVTKPWLYMGKGESFDYIKKKCGAVDMFLCIDTSKTKAKGLLEWWEIPSKAVIELYNRNEWQEANRAAYRLDKETTTIAGARFLQTMKWIFNK
jgi:hypothetical protein